MDTRTNLPNLRAAEEGMTPNDCLLLESCLLGSLSALVAPKDWDHAIETAKQGMSLLHPTTK